MTHLRKRMLEELQRRDFSQSTARIYLHVISDFARHFRRSPDTLGPEQIRQYQLYLFQKKLSPYTIRQHTAALRFLVLPRGFVRIRFYGFLANRRRANLLALCQQLLLHHPKPLSQVQSTATPITGFRCPIAPPSCQS